MTTIRNINYLTKEGYLKFEEELTVLRDQRRDEIAATLREIMASGDFEDSSEYDMVKAEQAFVEGRIRELEILLATARVIEEGQEETTDVVRIGSKVTVEEPGCPPEVYRIVGPAESNPLKGKISYASPLGRALVDRRKGDEVKVASPDGNFVVKILQVE